MDRVSEQRELDPTDRMPVNRDRWSDDQFTRPVWSTISARPSATVTGNCPLPDWTISIQTSVPR